MANQPVSAFSRTFANRDLFSGPARWAIFWSICSAVLLATLLASVGLLVGLLTDRGNLSLKLTEDELEEFNRFTGFELHHIGPTHERTGANAPEGQTGAPIAEVHELEGDGILPSVWRMRGRWYGPTFSWVFRRVDWLRHNDFSLVLLLLAVVVLWMLRSWCLHRIVLNSRVVALRIATTLRRSLHRQALRLSAEDIDEQSARSAIVLFNEQTDVVRQGLEAWIQIRTRYPLEIATAVFVACQIDLLLAVQWTIPLGLCWFLVEATQSRLSQARLLAHDRLRSEYQTLSEQLLNARLVRGFGMEQVEYEEFLKRLDHTLTPPKDLSSTQRRAIWLMRLTLAVCSILLIFLTLSLGLRLLHSGGEITWSGVMVFGLAIVVTLGGVRQLWTLRQLRQAISVAADQIFRYLDRMPSVSQAVGAKFLQPLASALHFDAVTYRTPSQKVLLDRVTLKLDAKKSYAVVSLDPLEAKAFCLLLPRFLEPQSGRVLIDGEDIAWATLESLRTEAVFVGGDDPPIRGTVLENLRAANAKYSLQEATEAAKAAHAHNFIVKLSQGYETVLTGRDDELDASQRFRLALARAILRNPALLIIEEPQANFDDDTKQLIDDSYQRILPGRTVIFLPSRLTTLKRVDQVLLLSSGQIAAQGPQHELIKQSALYRHWEYLHFNEFRHLERV